jgi:hypothetical protein
VGPLTHHDEAHALCEEDKDSIIETINERATEVRALMITIGSILALLMPAVEMIGILDITPYGAGDDEWITDENWEWESDFTCGDGSRIEAALVNDGYKNCRDGSDEPEEEVVEENNTVIRPPEGCTDPNADNYNESAEEEDGSCEYAGNQTSYGCTDENASNYDEWAEEDDGLCEYDATIHTDCGCRAEMWDAFWVYDNQTDNMTLTWDADLTCNVVHQLTVIWTFYYNNTTETGEWAGIQETMTYETTYQDWDYVNLTIAVPEGRYDIFSTFELDDNYYRGTDWFDVVIQ